jgi:hypothetical protein
MLAGPGSSTLACSKPGRGWSATPRSTWSADEHREMLSARKSHPDRRISRNLRAQWQGWRSPPEWDLRPRNQRLLENPRQKNILSGGTRRQRKRSDHFVTKLARESETASGYFRHFLAGRRLARGLLPVSLDARYRALEPRPRSASAGRRRRRISSYLWMGRATSRRRFCNATSRTLSDLRQESGAAAGLYTPAGECGWLGSGAPCAIESARPHRALQ